MSLPDESISTAPFQINSRPRDQLISDFPLPRSIGDSTTLLANSIDAIEPVDIYGLGLPEFIKPFPPGLWAVDFQYLKSKGALSLPDPDVQDALVDAYVQHVQSRFHLLSALDLVQMVRRREEQDKALSLLLYQSVLYTAAAFVDAHFIQKAGYSSRRAARKDLYDKTRVCLKTVLLKQMLTLNTYSYFIILVVKTIGL